MALYENLNRGGSPVSYTHLAFAVDDFKIYSGVYTGETQKPQITSTSPLYTIDQEAGTLLMNQSETDNIYLLVKNKLQGSFTGYTAADCKTKIGNADKMKTGNILVAKNAAGTIFNYYKVIVLAGGNKPEIEINGKAAQALGTGKVSASAYVILDSCETATLVPVSYTHLDVYKRQGVQWTHIGNHKRL